MSKVSLLTRSPCFSEVLEKLEKRVELMGDQLEAADFAASCAIEEEAAAKAKVTESARAHSYYSS